jgi:uncharacterized membrane protein YdjX (TVP38/TMEM64 family)
MISATSLLSTCLLTGFHTASARAWPASLLHVAELVMTDKLLSNFDLSPFEKLISLVESIGLFGLLLLFIIQVAQVVIAFLPGGGIELIGGVLYGALASIAASMSGIIVGSIIILMLCSRFGIPFAEKMVSEKAFARYSKLFDDKKFRIILLLLFFLPSLPKDILTYAVGVSGKASKDFFVHMMLARMPSVAAGAFAGAAAARGNHIAFITIYSVLCVVGLLGIVIHSRLIGK